MKAPQNREGIKMPVEKEKRKKGLGKYKVLSHAHLNLLYKSVELHSEGRNIMIMTLKNAEILRKARRGKHRQVLR